MIDTPFLLQPATAREHLEHALEQIARHDGVIRAMITVTAETAREQADRADEACRRGTSLGVMHGLILSLKDVIDTAGIRTTNGSRLDRDRVPLEDAEVVSRARRQGAIIIGKANLHEFAYGGTTQNPHYGSCRNPWDIERIPGGSSGGAGAAVAAGMCHVSLGTDTAGSGRLPASLCGVSALRPTGGRISNRGVTPVSCAFDTVSPMARRVSDIVRTFSALAGHDEHDAYCATRPVPDVTGAAWLGVSELRIGVPTSYFNEGVDSDVAANVDRAIEVLECLGARILPVDVPDAAEARSRFEHLFHTDFAAHHARRLRPEGDAVGADTLERIETLGLATSGVDSAASLDWAVRWRRRLKETFHAVDVIAHATCPAVAPTIAECASTTATTRRLAAFLYPWAMARIPVLTVPSGFAAHGMPCGLSLAAPWWREDLLFRGGEAFQRATDWHLIEPGLDQAAGSSGKHEGVKRGHGDRPPGTH